MWEASSNALFTLLPVIMKNMAGDYLFIYISKRVCCISRIFGLFSSQRLAVMNSKMI